MPTPLGPQSSICLLLGHIQGVPVALGFGMSSILCVRVVGLPSTAPAHQTPADDVINKNLV